MPQPTLSSARIDTALTNFSLAYMQNPGTFVADKVFPTIPVQAKTGKYWKFTQDEWFRDEAQKRPPATESAGGGFSVSTDSYSADVYAWHQDLADQEIANADMQLDLERAAVNYCAQKILLKREVEWASTFFTTGVWTTDSTPSNLWSNYATSSPVTDIETGALSIQSIRGVRPNTFVVGAQVHSQLINHPDLIDRIKYTTSDVVTNQVIARYFGVDRYFVMGALKNTAQENATASYSFIAGKNALLCYVDPAVRWGSETAGVTLMWDGVSDGMGATVSTVRIEMPLKRAVRIESQQAWDSKVVDGGLGYFFSSAVS
jgi:hypothetical protein